MQKIVDFFNSDWGRRIVKWAVTGLGVLVTSGTVPLDTPLFLGISLGQVLTIFGLAIPSQATGAAQNDQVARGLRLPTK